MRGIPRTVLNGESWSAELLKEPKFISRMRKSKFLRSRENNFMDLSQGRENCFQTNINTTMHKGDISLFPKLAYKL